MRRNGEVKRLLLRELSEDSRTSITDLARKVGCSRNTVMSNMSDLEKEMKMWYTLEFDRAELGLAQSHIWRLKFARKPDYDYIFRLMGREWSVQLVAKTEGDFDLLVKMVADNGGSYVDAGRRMLTGLAKYEPSAESCSVIEKRLGLVHLQNEILQRLDLTRFGIDALDKAILMELNANSRAQCSAIAKKLRQDEATVRYRIDRIIESGIIKRFTIVSNSPQRGYFAVFFLRHSFSPGLGHRNKEIVDFYSGLEVPGRKTNVLQYLASTIPEDVVFGMAHCEDEQTAIRDVILSHKKIFKTDSPSVSFAEIKTIMKGNIAFRNINVRGELERSSVRGGSA